MKWIGQHIISLLIAAIIVAVIAIIWGKEIAAAIKQMLSNKPTDPTAMPIPPATKQSTFPLKFGSEGAEVENLQRFLNERSNAGLTVDGVFGNKTQTATQQYLGTLQVTESYYNSVIVPWMQGSGNTSIINMLFTN